MNEQHPEADLPSRENVGPFLLLGVDKDADEAAIDAHWAERVLWCRKGRTNLVLEDVHWARDLLRDSYRRPAADADSLNPDLASGEVRRLTRLYHVDGAAPGWEPLDPEPPVELPGAVDIDPSSIATGLPAPDVPLELPAVGQWLESFAGASFDPWGVDAAR